VLRKGKRVVLSIAPNRRTWVMKYRCVRLQQTTEQQDAIWQRWKEGLS